MVARLFPRSSISRLRRYQATYYEHIIWPRATRRLPDPISISIDARVQVRFDLGADVRRLLPDRRWVDHRGIGRRGKSGKPPPRSAERLPLSSTEQSAKCVR